MLGADAILSGARQLMRQPIEDRDNGSRSDAVPVFLRYFVRSLTPTPSRAGLAASSYAL